MSVNVCVCDSYQFELRFKFLFPFALKSRQRFLYAASFVSLNHITHIVSISLTLLLSLAHCCLTMKRA